MKIETAFSGGASVNAVHFKTGELIGLYDEHTVYYYSEAELNPLGF